MVIAPTDRAAPQGRGRLRILADAEQLAWAAAGEVVEHVRHAVGVRTRSVLALAGGSTPRRLYELLVSDEAPFRSEMNWTALHFFWTDERHVPPDHPDSNYRMAYESMLSKAPIRVEHIHRIRAEEPSATRAAIAYEAELRAFFRLAALDIPAFDLVLLGLGVDGHTASLFRGSEAVHEQSRLVAAPWIEKLQSHRITLTPPVLNGASAVIVLVSGEEKAEILRSVLEESNQPDRFPIHVVSPRDGWLWLVDRAAASLLSPPTGVGS